MKQKQLLKPLFLLFVLLVGGLNSLWAEDVTVTLTQSNLELTGSYTSGTEKTIDGITYVYTDLMKNSDNIQAKASTGVIYNKTAFPQNIKSVAITHSGTARATTILGSSDGENWTQVATGSGSITGDFSNKGYKYFKITRGSNAAYWTKIEVTYSGSSTTNACATPTFNPEAGAYTSAQNVTINTTTAGATIYYTTDGTEPTTNSNAYTAAIPVSTTTTIKAIAVKEGMNNSSVATATYTIVSIEHAGTEADPYTVADARAAIDANIGLSNVYVKGIVSAIPTEYSTEYSNITFNIVDNEGDELFLQAFRCKGDEAANVQIGDIVVVSGNLTKYGSTYEFSQGCQLVSLTHTATTTPVINASDVELAYGDLEGTIEYIITNPETGVTLNATTDADWISNITVADDKVTFTTTANEGTTDRTATITLSYTGATDKAITITQAHYVAEVATLPFNWEGGASSELLNTAGVTANGLGTDYAATNSPYLVKFDNTGDYIQVKTDGQPGKVTIEVKMIGGATASSINVQGSADGETFTDVETLSISGSQNSTLTLETTKPFAADVRYVRLVFTKGSNVGVGAITIAKPSTDPEITADSEVELTADATSGEIAFSINNPVTEISLTATTTASWITDITVGTDKVTFTTSANTGDERTGTITLTYGSLTKDVTVTQAKYVAPAEEYTWVKTELANLSATDVFVIVGDNGGTYAMSNDNGTTSAPTAAEVEITGDIWTGAIADNLLWNISGNATEGYTFYPNGTTETWLYCTNTNNGVRVGTNTAKTFTVDAGYLKHAGTSRYVGIYSSQDWRCYTSSTTDNIKDQAFSFYKKADAVVTISSVGYKAYNTTIDTDFSGTGVTAYVVTGYTAESVTLEEVTAVPAGTPLVLKGDEGTYGLNEAENAVAPTKNLLQVSNGTVQGDGATIYALANVDGPGFYVVKEGLTIPTNYIEIPAGNAPALSFDFGEGTTGIRSIENGQLTIDNVYYDLSGRKLNAMPTQKGVYIVNGKKVVIK